MLTHKGTRGLLRALSHIPEAAEYEEGLGRRLVNKENRYLKGSDDTAL